MAKKDRNFLEAFLEGGEAVVDSLTDNEAVKAVPVIGTAIKLLKGLDDFRDRALAAKLASFFGDPALQSDKARQKLVSGIASDPEDARKIGETLFLVLDKVTDLDKPGLLANVFAFYLEGHLGVDELRRLAHAIDGAFTDDLIALREWKANDHAANGVEWKRNLAGVGLTTPLVNGRWDSAGSQTAYELTEIGKRLHCALTSVSTNGA
jgi:hypothetical protein